MWISVLSSVCSKVFRAWEWTSNASLCNKGCRIILGWNKDVVDVLVEAKSDQAIHAKIFHKADNKSMYCSFIYAGNNPLERHQLWADLGFHKNVVRGAPWIIMGDFNVALNMEDSFSGSSHMDSAMCDFKDCVTNIEVFDINSFGLHFTWNQKPKGRGGILKKLDRIMGNIGFVDVFLRAYALFQPYRISDHSPSVLTIPSLSAVKPKPFKFFNFLAYKESFSEVVSNQWTNQIEGHSMYQVVQKMKLLKKPFRKLMHDQGNLHDRVNRLRNELDEVQKALNRDPSKEAVYVQVFNATKIDEERFLKKREKIEWLEVGDSNSAYFHKTIKTRNQRSRIDVITNSDNVEVTGNQIPNVFVSHYKTFLGTNMICIDLDSDGLFLKRVSDLSNDNMTKPVTNEEIKRLCLELGMIKPQVQMVLRLYFSKRDETWWVKMYAMSLGIFFINGKLLKEINHTFLALIPKITTPLKVNYYRPISCCNVIYKCISKILTNRIIEGIKEVVSDNQSTFVPGRRISDSILVTQELMHNYHRDRGPPRCAFKLDIQKAYDTVNWRFLKHILKCVDFHPIMTKWIMACVTSTSFSLSINGNIHGYFKGKRGLRQGDHLSPYLFTLVMEILTLILQRRVRESDIYHKNYKDLNIINVCFTDDLFLFARGDVDSAKVIMDSLNEFKDVSGLVPSIPKSTAFFCNVLNHVKIGILNIMSCFEEYKRGKAKVAWEDICLPKHEGGLSLCNLEVFNRALMTTHIWNINSNRESLWVRWIHTYKLRGRTLWDVQVKAKVWNLVRTLVEMDTVQPILYDIMLWFQPVASKRTFQVIVGKMLLVATSYFIWRKRNNRLFKDTRRPPEEIRDLIMVTVRLKLISFRFKNTPRVQRLLALWKMPSNFRLYEVD
ncbi:hypothetical protein Tco_1491768 [Tanacetum coccineum]